MHKFAFICNVLYTLLTNNQMMSFTGNIFSLSVLFFLLNFVKSEQNVMHLLFFKSSYNTCAWISYFQLSHYEIATAKSNSFSINIEAVTQV